MPDILAPATRPGTVKAQLAAETLGHYAGDWAHFQDYCVERGAKVVPANPELVAAFLVSRVSGAPPWPGGWRPSTIDHQHHKRGVPPPGAEPSVRAVEAAGVAVPDPGEREHVPTSDAIAQLGGQHPHAVQTEGERLTRGCREPQEGILLEPIEIQMPRNASPSISPVPGVTHLMRPS